MLLHAIMWNPFLFQWNPFLKAHTKCFSSIHHFYFLSKIGWYFYLVSKTGLYLAMELDYKWNCVVQSANLCMYSLHLKTVPTWREKEREKVDNLKCAIINEWLAPKSLISGVNLYLSIEKIIFKELRNRWGYVKGVCLREIL